MRATPADVEAICGALPEVEFGTAWGDRPAWKVPAGARAKSFVLYRKPSKTAIDPATGLLFEDLIVVNVPDEETKSALVLDPELPFFTVEHSDGYNAVLVQESRLGEIERDRLEQILVEAWATRAPKALVTSYFSGR